MPNNLSTAVRSFVRRLLKIDGIIVEILILKIPVSDVVCENGNLMTVVISIGLSCDFTHWSICTGWCSWLRTRGMFRRQAACYLGLHTSKHTANTATERCAEAKLYYLPLKREKMKLPASSSLCMICIYLSPEISTYIIENNTIYLSTKCKH